MRYILEIVNDTPGSAREAEDTIECASPIPIPNIGDEILAPGGWIARVIDRQYCYTFVNKVPLVKVQVRCQKLDPEATERAKQVQRRK